MNANLLREKFLKYFEKNHHKIVESSSLIPAQDPTILFANAGMNQFKDLFLGNEKRSYDKATSSQKCVRAGGKHNDLDEVGFTDRHLTFFEMLGNFAFGSYFKEEAIRFAWDFLTKDLEIAEDKLSVTVHFSDQESLEIWNKKIGVPLEKITKLGDEDNFWQMGDVGPCGPCTEIFYDRGPAWEDKVIFGRRTTRYVEIWNLVFMQYSQQESGERKLLAQTGVDTGMGLERLAMVLNQGETVFDTEVFWPIFRAIQAATGHDYKSANLAIQTAFNVVADHLRSSVMIIADGGLPSNDGRGYVLRKIIRRGLLFLRKLTEDMNLFVKLVDVLAQEFIDIYPAVQNNLKKIKETLDTEINKFTSNLSRGQKYFDLFLEKAKSIGSNQLSGEVAFKLYDTYGFPLEVTRVLAREHGFLVDDAGFDQEMTKQKEQSAKKKQKNLNVVVPDGLQNEFVGYQTTSCESTVLWESEELDGLVWIATKETPFFAACGGQVSDQGMLIIDSIDYGVVEVINVASGINKSVRLIAIEAKDKDSSFLNKKCSLRVNPSTRNLTARNHSATHLLQLALRKVLGEHVTQAGSLVHPDYLRFLFTHNKSLTPEEICKTEQLLNSWVCQNLQTEQIYTSLDEANKMGAIALFGEKYNPETVRIIKIGEDSIELCGGTHVALSGEIGAFKIVSESSVGEGVRAIIAVTSQKAIELFQKYSEVVQNASVAMSCQPEKIGENLVKLQADFRSAQKNIEQLEQEMILQQIESLNKQFVPGEKFAHLICNKFNVNQNSAKVLNQNLVANQNSRVALFVNKESNADGFANFYFFISKDLVSAIDVQKVAAQFKSLGFRAGGKENFLQGSLNLADIEKCTEIILGL